MEATLQLYENIRKLQKKNRYTCRHMDDELGVSKGVFNMKMYRLKKGSTTSITVSDVGIMTRLFNCTANDIFNDVNFKKRKTK